MSESLMRDIRGDLQERVRSVAQQVNAENASFDRLISQIKASHESELEHLKAQLRLANKLIDFTVWHERLCAQLSARVAVAEAAENLIKLSLHQEDPRPERSPLLHPICAASPFSRQTACMAEPEQFNADQLAVWNGQGDQADLTQVLS
jgi:hypothetical protein